MAPNESPSLSGSADGLALSLWLCASVIIDSSFKTITLVAALTDCCQDLCVNGLKEAWKPTTCLSFPPGTNWWILQQASPARLYVEVFFFFSCDAITCKHSCPQSSQSEGMWCIGWQRASWKLFYIVQLIVKLTGNNLDLLGIRLLNGISEIQK